MSDYIKVLVDYRHKEMTDCFHISFGRSFIMVFSTRMRSVHKSFVREILKATVGADVISFAGGLPNPDFFAVEQINDACSKVLSADGKRVLQYSTTEGFFPLRKYICDRYYNGMKGITPDNIVITCGSQQALDLICKVFLDKSDNVLIERPGYLGAIQCFSVFEPNIESVELNNDGININELNEKIKQFSPKLFYMVPNFQNPTGITYSYENRKKISEIIDGSDTIIIEDNPYGELKFNDTSVVSMKNLIGDKVISLGSFSKIFAPSMRLGWICASDEIIKKIILVKQASDLHTNYFSQRVLFQYLTDNDLNNHIDNIRHAYNKQKNIMIDMMEKYFPKEVEFTNPDGGMFLWLTLPNKFSTLDLFNRVAKRNVVFVPGNPFYVNVDSINTCRLNYTNSSDDEIKKGIMILGDAIKETL